MKKIILVLTLALTFVLVGCNFKKIERNVVDANKDVSTKIDLNIQLPFVSENMSSNPAIPLLEELTGYKTNYTQFPAGSLAETELEGYFMDKKTDYHAVKLNKNQFNKRAISAAGLADLTEIINSPKYATLKNSIKQEAWDAVTYDGKILGIPDSASNNNIDKALIIRKDIMYNLTNPSTGNKYTEVPTTFEGFVELLEVFKAETGYTTAFTLPKNLEIVPTIAASFGVEQMWQDINGELVYAAENPNLPKYLTAMNSLHSKGLLDRNMQTNSFATSSDLFAKGRAIATVSNFWEMATVKGNLANEGGKKLEDSVGFIEAFANEKGEYKNWQSSGVSYATVIPNWMFETGAYVIDYIQTKIVEENFARLIVGQEDVTYKYDEIRGEYYPLDGFSAATRSADQFVTGTNDKVYNKYWTQVVIKGIPEFYFQWKTTNEDAFKSGMIGVLDPTRMAPAFNKYSASAAGFEDEFKGGVMRVIFGDKNESAETIKNKFNAKTNQEALNEVRTWYKNK